MVNCTAAERLDSTDVFYGDYMDSVESIVFINSTYLSGVKFIKQRIGSFGAPIIV
jgi:hypothetical protein